MNARKAFRNEFDDCFLCGREWRSVVWGYGLQVHEIVRGVHRKQGVKHRAAWLLLCQLCHQAVGSWPVVKQLALKKLRDPEYYDRELVNRLRDREPDAITEEEVILAMKGL